MKPHVIVALTACWLTATAAGASARQPAVQDEEPIAYVGHGAFFDRSGNQIRVTQAFLEKAQAWYREQMLSALNARQKRDFAAVEQKQLAGGGEGQARLAARQRALEWLIANSPRYKNDDRTLGKLRALDYALKRSLPES
jgi:hypothetical protein